MKREIYLVNAKVVDASGAYNDANGYPISFDSHQNSDNIEKTEAKAYASYYSACSAGETARSNGRPLTVVTLTQMSTGMQIEGKRIGKMPELPDPTYAVTVTNGTGSGSYVEGATVTISADNPIEGTVFGGWNGTAGLTFISGSAETMDASFLMPATAVAVEATYQEAPAEEENGGEE